MDVHSTICMLSSESYEVVNEYRTVQEASEDTLTTIEDIYSSLAEGKVINGYIWNRHYIKKVKPMIQTKKVSHKKAVIQYDTEGNVVNMFSSVAEATKLTGITNIDKAARGIIQLAGGYTWQYALL